MGSKVEIIPGLGG